MKNIIEITVYFVVLIILMACQSSVPKPVSIEKPLSTDSTTPTSTVTTPDSPALTASVLVTPIITATPINANFNTEDEMARLVKQLFPWAPCTGYNYAKSSPGMPPPSKLEFIEVDVQPDPQKYWILEIADNVNKSRQAFVACNPELCQEKIYVKDNETKKVFEINWEWRMPWRPIDSITWINTDTLAFYQSINPERAQIIIVNFDKREYLYNALVFPDYFCSTSTPTP